MKVQGLAVHDFRPADAAIEKILEQAAAGAADLVASAAASDLADAECQLLALQSRISDLRAYSAAEIKLIFRNTVAHKDAIHNVDAEIGRVMGRINLLKLPPQAGEVHIDIEQIARHVGGGVRWTGC